MDVLVACETSGVVRDAFLAKGHRAISCDIQDTKAPGPHLKTNVLYVLEGNWDMIIAFPPCTHLCVSGARWFKDKEKEQKEAIDFFMRFVNAPCPKIVIENPIGIMSTVYRKPDQIIQPYQFGHDASKSTCLWLKGVPLLKRTGYVFPRIVLGKKRWGNQTDSGQNRLSPSAIRGEIRSRTYEGIAKAMAEQWG